MIMFSSTTTTIFFLTFVIFFFSFGYIVLAETVEPIACVDDGSHTGRNILEITGDHSTKFFSVILSSSNCHIYIHDVAFCGISFASTVENNSNITIRNATSTNKTRSLFINFANVVSDFGFINISDINHSSLTISPTASTKWIVGVMFSSTVIGKTELTSTISISNFTMSDIRCDSSSGVDCWASLVRFGSITSNVASIHLQNFTASDITMKVTSIGWAVLTCHCFDELLYSVQQIVISHTVVSRVSLESLGIGHAELRLSQFSSNVSASPTGETRIAAADYSLRNVFASTTSGNGFQTLFHVGKSITNFEEVSFVNMSMEDVKITSSSGRSNTVLLEIGGSMIGPTSAIANQKSSSIIVHNIHMLRINSTTFDYVQVTQMYVTDSIINYPSLSFSNMFVADVNANSSDDYARIITISVNTAIFTEVQMSSSFLFANFRMERVNCAGWSYAHVYHFVVGISIINYSHFSVSDMYIEDANLTSSNEYCLMLILSVGGSLVAPPPPPLQLPSTIVVNKFQVTNVSSFGATTSTVYLFYVADNVTEYNTASFSNVVAVSVRSNASKSYAKVRVVYFGSFAATASSDSSFTVQGFHLERIKTRTHYDVIVGLFFVDGSITNYSRFLITNMTVIDVNSSSHMTNSNAFMFYCSRSLIAPQGFTSSLIVNSFKMERVTSRSVVYAFVYLFLCLASIENYGQVIYSNISATDVHSTSVGLYSFVMAFVTAGLLASSSALDTYFIVSNVTLRNIVSIAPTSARIMMLIMNSPALIRGFDSVTFSDSLMQNVSIPSASASSYILAFSPGGFQECNTIRVSNNIFQDIVIASTISSVASIALVSATSSSANCRLVEVNNNSISNISVVAPTQNAEINLMNLPFGKVNNISIHNNNITLHSLPQSATISPNILVSMFPLSISSSTARFNLDISNCSLELRNQYWQHLCNSAKCSLIRVNDVQQNNNNNNISISESSVTSPSSSFISFANFGNGAPNRADAILNFVVENDHFLNLTSSSPIFGFDMPSRLPPLTFVDVKCNHWLHETDRVSASQIILASSAVQANQFVQWSCPFHSPSRSLSITSTSSFGAKAASTSNQILAVVTNVAQSIGIVAVATVSAVSPSLGFGVARQQAMVNFMQNIRDGDCSGISDPNEVPAADSPTQRKIGISDAKLYVGGAVGNTILSISLILAMQIGGTLALKFSGSSSWNRPFDVFARCNVALVGYVCASLLLAPTLTFGLVSVSVSNVENLSVGSKILAIIFSIVYAVATFYYAIWSVFLRPNMKLEQHRKLPKKNTKVSFIIRMLNFLFEGEGEWMLHKKANLSEKLNFDAATPMFEGYNGRAKWFGLVEFVVQVGLALAPFLANLVPVEKSCVTTFSVLIVVLGGYLFFCIWLRPFQERFNRIVIPIVTLSQIGVVILTYVYAENPPDFIVSLAMATVSLQNAMTVVVLFASFSPLMKHALRAYRKLKKWWSNRKQQKSSKNSKNHVPSLRYLMDEVENDEQELHLRNKTRKHDGKSTKNKKYAQNLQNQRQSRTHRTSETKTSQSKKHIPSAEPMRNDSSRRSSNNNNNNITERKRLEHEETNAERRNGSNRRESQQRNFSPKNNSNNNRGSEDSRSRRDDGKYRDSDFQARK